MPWTPIASINGNNTIPTFNTTFTGDDRTNTVSLGDLSSGDTFDVICTFPTDIVENSFIFNPSGLTAMDVVCIFPNPDNNQMTFRFRSTRDTINFGRFTITFGLDESSPNYSVTLVHV